MAVPTTSLPEEPPADLQTASPQRSGDAHFLPAVGHGTLPIRRILVVHTERMGDVLCATPVFAALKHRFPGVHLEALLHRPHDQLVRGGELDDILLYDRQTTHRTWRQRLELIGELRERSFDWALVLHAASSVAFALAHSGIPWRTVVWREGARRPPHWRHWYHQHIRQDRNDQSRHEIEYNLDVLRQLGIDAASPGYRVHLSDAEICWARDWLTKRGHATDRPHGRPLIVLHPGHGGGRQVWPETNYAELARQLSDQGCRVAVTGTEKERPVAERICAAAPGALMFAGELTQRQLAAVLAHAAAFVSVSTGPMHLASAMGVPTATLYGPSDLRHEIVRFSPYGSRTESVLSPLVCPCPDSHKCKNPVCMPAITVEAVFDAVRRLCAAPEDPVAP